MGFNFGRGLNRFIEDFGYGVTFAFFVVFMVVYYLLEEYVENDKTKKIIWAAFAVFMGFVGCAYKFLIEK